MVAVLRFVDSIAASPTTRLDLNDLTNLEMNPETRFPDPPLRRAITSSMVRDGDYVGASAYGNREIPFKFNIRATASDTAATQMQLLNRELDRATNILQYQPGGATAPVFFRTFRTSPDDVRWDPSAKQVSGTLMAEPFAIGVREDAASSVTVNNNPAAGSNGLFLDLTGIKGDVETPLFIEYTDGGSGPTRPGLAIGVRSGTPYPTLFNQAESYTLTLDTTAVVDAAFSGGNKARTTFATSTTGLRLNGNFPSLTDPAGAENWGAYRVFARVAQTVAGDVIKINVNSNDYVTIASQTQAQLIDLGIVDSRGGTPTSPGYAGTSYRIEDQIALFVRAERVSGSGSLDWDYLVFVPADYSYGGWGQFAGATAAGHLGVIDGVNEATYIATALSGATPGRIGSLTVPVVGGFPRVRPGSNRLVIVQVIPAGTAPLSNLLATAYTMSVRYWPRYLHVRPATT